MDGSAAGGFLETEQKFEVDADFAIPDLTGVPAVAAVGAPQTYHLRATYYDTADFRLAAAHITLRKRSGGADDGWHLKLPAGAGSRREIHERPGAGDETVPATLAALVLEQTGGRPLRPIATMATTRTVRHLTGADGQALAEIADDSVTGALPAPGRPSSADRPPPAAAGNPPDAGGAPADGGARAASAWREAARWREVEVELHTGTRDLLEAVGARLRAAGARPAALGSKLARLLAAR